VVRRLGGLIAGITTIAGCSSGPGEKALDDVLPWSMSDHAYRRFALAVCDGDWGTAYARLAKSNRDQVSYLEFRIGAPFAEDPRTGVSIIDLICKSAAGLRLAEEQPSRRDVEFLVLHYTGADAGGKPVAYRIGVPMHDERRTGAEEPDWKVDLLYAAEVVASGGR